ncbi:hypothetical protein C0989_001636 [Termitomyces sp. Mn162]|nr:hypothetical protein C0989_001636 [Termitomyces sp. Mn162]
MPYSLPVHAAGHRRSHSGDHGALPSTLPRRRNATPVFHFNNDQDSSSDSDSPHTIPALKLKSRPISFHGAPTAVVPLPLPVQRTNSSPILLSNGKPLKSSLKSSPSAPSMPSSPTEEHPLGPAGRTRASSTPNTPALDHHVPKNVHFPSNKLATVRFYSRSARPASLSLADGGDTETETESERSPYPSFAFPNTKIKGKKMVHTLDTALSSLVPAPSPPAHANVYLESLALHHTSNHAPISSTSSLPFPSSSSSPLSSSTSLSLKGTLLVRNLAYEKTVAVRFTLDEWDTTSEVLAHYTASLPALPPALYVPGSGLQNVHPGVNVGTVDKPAWDRFTFTIRLDDYVPSLATRTLWLVVRYCTPTAGSAFGSGSGSGEGMGIGTEEAEQGGSGNGSNNEWWDNNGGRNYRVVFRLGEESEAESVGKRTFLSFLCRSRPRTEFTF